MAGRKPKPSSIALSIIAINVDHLTEFHFVLFLISIFSRYNRQKKLPELTTVYDVIIPEKELLKFMQPISKRKSDVILKNLDLRSSTNLR